MRIVVYGAGAIGGVIGARLHQGGHDVALIARGHHFEAIRDRGLRLDCGDESAILDVPVFDGPAAAGLRDGDVVVLAMKTQDTEPALRELEDAAPTGVPIVCAQNAVENERMALRRFPDVYGICVMCPTAFLEPGVVVAFSTPVTGILDVGRFPDGTDPVVSEVAAAFASSTFVSEPRDDIMRWKYRKLVMNLANAAEAVAGPEARLGPLGTMVRDEGESVLAAAGIPLVTEEEDAARRGDLLTLKPAGEERWRGGSSWQSLARGTGTIEADYLNGEVVLLARRHGVAAPVNDLLRRLANEMARSGERPGSRSEDEVLALLD